MPSLEDRERAFTEGPNQLEPFDLWPGDTDRMPPLPFPLLLNAIPRGWKLVYTYTVYHYDYSINPFNLTTTNPFRLTLRQFIDRMEVGKGYAFITKGPTTDIIAEYEVIHASPELD